MGVNEQLFVVEKSRPSLFDMPPHHLDPPTDLSLGLLAQLTLAALQFAQLFAVAIPLRLAQVVFPSQ